MTKMAGAGVFDAKTGCEWLLVHGAGLVPRTAANGAGGVSQVCNTPSVEDAP